MAAKGGASAKPSAALKHEGTLRGKHVANVLAGKIDFLRMVDGGAYRHFEGAEPTGEGEAVQGYVSVSARHDRLNGRLKSLIERDLVEKVVQVQEIAPKLTFTKPASGLAGDTGDESPVETKLSPDAYLRKLIDEEAPAG